MKEKISIIVPCYNEEEALPLFCAEMSRVRSLMDDVAFDLIFVDDGSSDGTLIFLKELKARDSSVRYLSFSRNFGKEAAILAGLEVSDGNWVATLDADLQDPPSLLPEMLTCLRGGDYDCAATRRVTRRGEPLLRSLLSRLYYRLMARISDAHIVDGTRDFRLMKRQMADAVLSLREYNRFSKGIFSWVGFKTRWFEFENIERSAGETKWSLWKLFLYSLEGILAFSTAPLVLASIAGFVFCLISFFMICVVIIKTLLWGDPVDGYPSLMSVILFIGGIQLFSIGIVGQYLAKTYLETKRRPVYIIKEKSQE
jgi:glucosyltransferase